MPKLAKVVVVVCTLAALVSACGSSAKKAGVSTNNAANSGATRGGNSNSNSISNASGGSASACKLVTQSDASALFGHPAAQTTDAAGSTGLAQSACLWKFDTAPGAATGQSYLLQVRVYDKPVFYNPNLIPGTQIISGVGDQAYAYGSGEIYTFVFKKGNNVVHLAYSIHDWSNSGMQAKDQAAKVLDMAKTAAGRL
jgi:hypothetical protein